MSVLMSVSGSKPPLMPGTLVSLGLLLPGEPSSTLMRKPCVGFYADRLGCLSQLLMIVTCSVLVQPQWRLLPSHRKDQAPESLQPNTAGPNVKSENPTRPFINSVTFFPLL